jgi:hypothetical protein
LVNDYTGLTGAGRYVRMYGTARTTGYGYSIYQMEVYGTAKSASEATSIANASSENVSIYPNPVTSQLNIRFNETSNYKNISLFDFTGKLVLQQNIENVSGNAIVNVEMLKSGIYFIRLTGTTQSNVFKIVKE